MRPVPIPFLVDEEKLKLAHSPDYIRALKSCDKTSEGEYYDKYGLSYDCPPRDELYKRALLIYSSTMSCAFALLENKFDICLNWLGGWHHAKRSKASGFCYVNDINGAINYFVQNKKKVLYIDLGPFRTRNNNLRRFIEASMSLGHYKVWCAFPMVISSEFHMR